MRPYLALLIDSFRAAMASRVLYVLLGLILILLAALAPFHFRESLEWSLQTIKHVRNPPNLVRQLAERKDSEDHPEVKRIWDLLTEESKTKINKIYDEIKQSDGQKTTVATNNQGRRRGRRDDLNQYFGIVGNLNSVISDRDFYRPEDWEGMALAPEARELIEQGTESLDDERSKRLNRLLITQALPAIEPPTASSITFYYAFFTYEEYMTISSTREQVNSNLTTFLSAFFDKFVLSIGILVAILVTANIVPETFDPGSLNLLLSKPITRPSLYLTKFFGGCFLILICSVLLFLGLWLWMGLAFGCWDRALLWSIPLYVLVFAIYYSVSAFIGMLYRSAILAVVVTILFWGVCYAWGFGYQILNSKMENTRLYNVAADQEKPLAFDGLRRVVRWNPEDESWKPVAAPKAAMPGQDSALGFASWFDRLKEEPFRLSPVTDSQGRSYVGVNHLLDLPNRGNQDCYFAENADANFRKIGKFPRNAMAMFPTENGLLVVDRGGNFHLLDPALIRTQEDDASEEVEVKPEPTGDTMPQETGDLRDQPPTKEPEKKFNLVKQFKRIGPANPIDVGEIYSVDLNQSNQEIAIHQYRDQAHRVFVFRPTDDGYVQDRSVEFDLGSTNRIRCFIAYQGNTIVIAGGNGQVITFDGDTLEERKGYRPETTAPIDGLEASPDGRWFALCYLNKRLWLLDAESDDSISLANVTGQGNVSSASFNQANELCVIDREDRVTCYEPATMTAEESFSAKGGWFEASYRYVIKPLYYVFPKPSEFYRVVQHLSSTKDTTQNAGVDLIGTKPDPNPFLPLWTGLGFMATMLTISCLIFSRRDY